MVSDKIAQLWDRSSQSDTLSKVSVQKIFISKAFDTIHRGKLEEIILSYSIPQETISAVMMLYRNSHSMVRSPDGDIKFFNIIAGVLQGDTLAPFIFIMS